MNIPLIVIGLTFIIVAGAMFLAGWAINRLDRRVTALEDRMKVRETEHRLLVGETQQAFQAWHDAGQ